MARRARWRGPYEHGVAVAVGTHVNHPEGVAVVATGIERDGTKGGPDVRLLRSVRKAAPTLAVIGSGGIGDLAHLQQLAAAGAEAAIVGRALYDGDFTLRQAIDRAR